MEFKNVQLGLFRYKGVVYSKINDKQAVLITNGRMVDFEPNQEVEEF